MIQELISTSAPRCLNGNAGFGIVAQTVGMAQNVSLAVNALSGYTHVAPPGSPQNPVVYLHAIRRTGGMLRHIVSRIADCGNDYSGRSNRFAHHWIIEEEDVRLLPGGPAALLAQNAFLADWKGRSRELSPRKLIAADAPQEKCATWEALIGDAGWGGIVAERAEKGDPISIVFPQGFNSENLLKLIGGALALLSPAVRWRITFSTYSMKSQEASGDTIQIKCFLAGSEESQFVRQSPNTLVIDLQQRLGDAPDGKYVVAAWGAVKSSSKVPLPDAIPIATTSVPMSVPGTFAIAEEPKVPVVSPTIKKPRVDYSTGKDRVFAEESPVTDSNWYIYLGTLAAIMLAVGIFFAIQWYRSQAPPLDPLPMNNEALENLRQELATAQQLIEALEQNVTELTGSAEQNKKEISDLKSENRDLKDKVDLAEELENKNVELTNENTRLKNEIQELKRPERQDIADNLKNLPTIWRGLALPRNSNAVPLDGSTFLGAHRDEMKIELVSFANLESPITHEQISIVYDLPEPHNIIFKYPDTISTPGQKIAEISLAEEGLRFKWEDDRDRNSVHWHQIKNRILLSKLRIAIAGHSHEVALWTPYNAQQQSWFFFDDSSELSVEATIKMELLASQLHFMLDKKAMDVFGTTAEDFKEELQWRGLQPEHIDRILNAYGIQRAEIHLLHPTRKDKLLLMEGVMP
ncbi:MAG: hypothetical protein FWE95_03480 [Planctomycetaceae bacterium]|nr:hypothetical protein [Planctomycetaceae bacterium]